MLSKWAVLLGMLNQKEYVTLLRGIEATNKNHNQEVRSLMLKNRALSNEAEDLRNASERLHAQLKVKYMYTYMCIKIFNFNYMYMCSKSTCV